MQSTTAKLEVKERSETSIQGRLLFLDPGLRRGPETRQNKMGAGFGYGDSWQACQQLSQPTGKGLIVLCPKPYLLGPCAQGRHIQVVRFD